MIIRVIIISLIVLIFSIGCRKSTTKKEFNSHFTVHELSQNHVLFQGCKFNPKDIQLKMVTFLEDEIGTIRGLLNQKEDLLFATNGGIFQKNYTTSGLLIKEGKMISKVNNKNGKGNFYLKPNGIFSIDKNNKASIVSTPNFDISSIEDINLAIQSGPLLVLENKIHPVFRESSKNVNIRNGVGVDTQGNIHFLISNERVNLYQFAQIFKDSLDCPNALYLDGFISEMYISNIRHPSFKRQFATILYIENE